MPGEPRNWFGNGVAFREPPGDGAALLARFRADHPGARLATLVRDLPDMDAGLAVRAPDGPGMADETVGILAQCRTRTHRPRPPASSCGR